MNFILLSVIHTREVYLEFLITFYNRMVIYREGFKLVLFERPFKTFVQNLPFKTSILTIHSN